MVPTSPAGTSPEHPIDPALAFSLPPRFAAVGVATPVTVSAEAGMTDVSVVDREGNLVAALQPVGSQLFSGTVPGSAARGGELLLQPRAVAPSGQTVVGEAEAIPVVASNGMQLARHDVVVTPEMVYNRPWSAAIGELYAERHNAEGPLDNPPGLAALSEREVAVLDSAASRITCFDTSGTATC